VVTLFVVCAGAVVRAMRLHRAVKTRYTDPMGETICAHPHLHI